MNKFIGYIFVVAFLAAIIINSKVPASFIFKGLKPIFLLIMITAILNILMTSGTPETLIFKWKFIKIYTEGLRLAGFMALRLIFLIIGTYL